MFIIPTNLQKTWHYLSDTANIVALLDQKTHETIIKLKQAIHKIYCLNRYNLDHQGYQLG